MTPIRVALLVSNLSIEGPAGGIGRFVDELSRALAADQFSIRLYALWRFDRRSEEPVRQRLSEAGVKIFVAADWDERHPYQSFWKAVGGLRAAFAAEPVDIVHSHHEFADVAALWLRRAARATATIRTVHNEEWKIRPLRRVLLTNGWYPLAFRIEAGVSQAIVNRLNQRPLARALRRRSVVLHNALNLERFRTLAVDRLEERRRLGIPADAPLVGSVGRLTEQKGYGYFVEAAAKAWRQLPGVYFVLIGAGEQEAALRYQAAQLGLADRLRFAGARPDVERLLATFDLFVSSSLWEGLPTVIMESMAAGVPVVATDILGTRELLSEGESGRLVPPGNATALAAAIVEMLSDTPRRAQLAAQASRVVERFSIRVVAAQHEQLYLKLCDR